MLVQNNRLHLNLSIGKEDGHFKQLHRFLLLLQTISALKVLNGKKLESFKNLLKAIHIAFIFKFLCNSLMLSLGDNNGF